MKKVHFQLKFRNKILVEGILHFIWAVCFTDLSHLIESIYSNGMKTNSDFTERTVVTSSGKKSRIRYQKFVKKTTKYNKNIIHVIDWSKWWKNVTEWETVQLYSSKIGFNQNSRIRILLEESHDLSRWLSSLICIIQSNRFTRLKGKQWLMLQGWY